MDLPDFVKESVPQIQILCTFQADFSRRNSGFKVGFMDALMEPDFLAKSELFYSDMVGVSGSQNLETAP